MVDWFILQMRTEVERLSRGILVARCWGRKEQIAQSKILQFEAGQQQIVDLEDIPWTTLGVSVY